MINIKDLNKEDMLLALEMTKFEVLFDFVKKNKKKFNNTIKGARLDKNSQLLKIKIPQGIVQKIEDNDVIVIKFVRNALKNIIDDINDFVIKKFEDEKKVINIMNNTTNKVDIGTLSKAAYYENVLIKTNKKENYEALCSILLEKIKRKHIVLYLKLNQVNLSVGEEKILEQSIEESVKKEEKERHYKEITNLKVKHNSELEREKALNIQLKNNINEINKKNNEKVRLINEKIRVKNDENNNLSIKVKQLNNNNKKLLNQLENCKRDYEIKLKKEFNLNTTLQEKVNKLNKQLRDRYDNYSKEYELRWREENKNILDEETTLKLQVKKLKENVKELESSVKNLELMKIEKKEKLDKYNDLVKNFINNIDKEIIISSLKKSIFNMDIPIKNNQQNSNLYIKEDQDIDKEEIILCEDIDDFSEYVSENLKEIGVDRKIINELSDYIVGVLASKMVPLITGYRTREVAKAISYAYCGESPLVVNLPSGYNNVNELVKLYNECKSKVILIEGLVGQMNEGVMLTLFKEYIESKNNEKIILISCEDDNMVDLMPKYLYEYIALIKILDIKPVVKHKYIHSNAINVLQDFINEDIKINENYKILKILFRGANFDKSYIMSRTLILSYLCKLKDEINAKAALKCIFICDIKLMLKDNEIKDKVLSNIKSNIEIFDPELIDTF